VRDLTVFSPRQGPRRLSAFSHPSLLRAGHTIVRHVNKKNQEREESVTDMGFIPLSERRSIDLNDSTLDKGICSDEFVVRRIIYLRTHNRGNVQ